MLSLFIPVGIILVASLAILSSISTHLFLLQLAWVGVGVAVITIFYFVALGRAL